MKRALEWVSASDWKTWAQAKQTRDDLPRLVGQLVRASAPDISSYRFPYGENSEIPGWDGLLEAEPYAHLKAYVPQGFSAWEFGTGGDPQRKVESDYRKRTADPGSDVDPSQTHLVLVTPRTFAKAREWVESKKADSPWKSLRVLDAVDLQEWLALCPAAAAQFARECGFVPPTGVLSLEEYWDTYSRRFDPPLTEAVPLAGRDKQSPELLRSLAAGSSVRRFRGDSLDEVLGFLCAAVFSAEKAERDFC